MGNESTYLEALVERFWKFRTAKFDREGIFDQLMRGGMRPPVFLSAHALSNVIVDPDLTDSQISELQCKLPASERHHWFRSMKSSQALVQSVFGNLCAMRLCSALKDVKTEEGGHPFTHVREDGSNLKLDCRIATLGEPHPTSVDIFVEGMPTVAIECKLAEADVGHCSRPQLREDEPGYCDGTYRRQRGRQDRYALTASRVKYWEFVPRLFNWPVDRDLTECPLRLTYQLVRNVLAATVDKTGKIGPGFAVLLLDDRNPAFQSGGPGFFAFAAVKHALIEPNRIQQLSWQTVMRELR